MTSRSESTIRSLFQTGWFSWFNSVMNLATPRANPASELAPTSNAFLPPAHRIVDLPNDVTVMARIRRIRKRIIETVEPQNFTVADDVPQQNDCSAFIIFRDDVISGNHRRVGTKLFLQNAGNVIAMLLSRRIRERITDQQRGLRLTVQSDHASDRPSW